MSDGAVSAPPDGVRKDFLPHAEIDTEDGSHRTPAEHSDTRPETAHIDKVYAALSKNEQRLRDFEGISGFLKGLVHIDKRAGLELQQADLLAVLEKERGELLALLGGQDVAAQARAETVGSWIRAREKVPKKEHEKVFAVWKQLGEANIFNLAKEKGWKIPDFLHKNFPWTAQALRSAGRVLSVRSALTAGLIAGGGALGAAVGAGTGFLIARGVGALGGALGGHDVYEGIGRARLEHALKSGEAEKKGEEKKGFAKIFDHTAVDRLSLSELDTRLAQIEGLAVRHHVDVSTDERYLTLLRRREEYSKESVEKHTAAMLTIIADMGSSYDSRYDERYGRYAALRTGIREGSLARVVCEVSGAFLGSEIGVAVKGVLEWMNATLVGDIARGTVADVGVMAGKGVNAVVDAMVGTRAEAFTDTSKWLAFMDAARQKPLSVREFGDLRRLASLARMTPEGTAPGDDQILLGDQARTILKELTPEKLKTFGIHEVRLGKGDTVQEVIDKLAHNNPELMKKGSLETLLQDMGRRYGIPLTEKLTVADLDRHLHRKGEHLWISKDGLEISQNSQKLAPSQLLAASPPQAPIAAPVRTGGDMRESMRQGLMETLARKTAKRVVAAAVQPPDAPAKPAFQQPAGESPLTVHEPIPRPKKEILEMIIEKEKSVAKPPESVPEIEKPVTAPLAPHLAEGESPLRTAAQNPDTHLPEDKERTVAQDVAAGVAKPEGIANKVIPLDAKVFDFSDEVRDSRVEFMYNTEGTPLGYRLSGQFIGNEKLENLSAGLYDLKAYERVTQDLTDRAVTLDLSAREGLTVAGQSLWRDIRLLEFLQKNGSTRESSLVEKGIKNTIRRIATGFGREVLAYDSLPAHIQKLVPYDKLPRAEQVIPEEKLSKDFFKTAGRSLTKFFEKKGAAPLE